MTATGWAIPAHLLDMARAADRNGDTRLATRAATLILQALPLETPGDVQKRRAELIEAIASDTSRRHRRTLSTAKSQDSRSCPQPVRSCAQGSAYPQLDWLHSAADSAPRASWSPPP